MPRRIQRALAIAGTWMGAFLMTQSPSPASQAGYIFATFRGEETPLSEQVHFAVSRDGRSWSALNGGAPVLVSGIGERGVRDPFLLRLEEGAGFVLIATDLSIHRDGDWKRAITRGSRSILVWESPDLATWTGPRLVEVAPSDAGCAWAPEAVFDRERGDYLVFWASTTGRDEFAKHRIWARHTPDFRSFGEPFVLIEKETTIIDTTIVHDGTHYVRFTKDEKFKAITMETSPRLSGPWSDVADFSLARLIGFEGPQCYPVQSAGKEPAWMLILDHYARGEGYKPFTTDALAGGVFRPAEGFTFPFRFRHGSVLPLKLAELEAVERAFAAARTDVAPAR